MIMYKIFNSAVSDEIFIIKDGTWILKNSGNTSYNQFIQDVAEQGLSIVEGPDIIEPDYATLRQQEYPSIQEQEDMKYWDEINGTTVWRDTITAIKDKYPKTITGGTTIGEVPSWVQEAADNWTFNKQLREYADAIERLGRYVLSEGRPELTEEVVVETREVFNEETDEFETVNVTRNVVIQTAIEPLEEFVEVTEFNEETMESTVVQVRNPLVVKDEEERAAAQAVVDATPQAVIDAINS
jgi:hypothetical protein